MQFLKNYPFYVPEICIVPSMVFTVIKFYFLDYKQSNKGHPTKALHV